MSETGRPQPDESTDGNELPLIVARPPGPNSRTYSLRHRERAAPMGPRRAAGTLPGIVIARGNGSNVFDVDGNRYVDLAAGFGALLLGHRHPAILRAIELQSQRLFQALGDVYPSDAKIGLLDRLASLSPIPDTQIILGQSGADAITAALKTAQLYTSKSGLIAFTGSYHGLSHGPLAVSDLRPSYRVPFQSALEKDVSFVAYPCHAEELDRALGEVEGNLKKGTVGGLIVEPILGRGGAIVPPPGFLSGLIALARKYQALTIFDEIWTGLGRTGTFLALEEEGAVPDLICLGKGLGGGLPISACLGSKQVMACWSQAAEVVHTSTFAGAPLSVATALAALDVLGRQGAMRQGAKTSAAWRAHLASVTGDRAILRGRGMMVGLDVSTRRGGASRLQAELLERGYLTTTGGGARDVLILTPPLTIPLPLLEAFDQVLSELLG